MSEDSTRRIEALEAAVAELREQLLAVTQREPRVRSMRQTHRCPACGGTKLVHFRRVREAGHNQVVDLALQKGFSIWRGAHVVGGALEAFACRACRLVEWDAVTLDDIVADPEEITEIDGDVSEQPPSTPSTPYR